MFRRILSLIVLAAAMGFAQFAPEPQVADIKLMMDPKTEQPMKMDFSTHLSGISDPGILFAHFSNRPLLIYYLAPSARTVKNTSPRSRTSSRNMNPRVLRALPSA